jgi:hypothetical protein
MMLTDHHFKQRERPVTGLTFQETLAFTSTKLIFTSATDETNQKISYAQNELLLWHHKLCHCDLQRVQTLLCQPQEGSGHCQVLFPKCKEASSCHTVLCAACQVGKQVHKSSGFTRSHQPQSGQDLTAQRTPGEWVSIDQYVSALPRRLPKSKGKEKKGTQYNGGNIFVDHATSYIHHSHQVSLRVGDTIKTKHSFEKFASNHGVHIKKYHADNALFGARDFRTDLEIQGQDLSFSGVGAHHQNGAAERAFGITTKWDRIMLLHVIIHWHHVTSQVSVLQLWSFATDRTIYMWNNMPSRCTRRSPVELFTSISHENYDHLQLLHV